MSDRHDAWTASGETAYYVRIAASESARADRDTDLIPLALWHIGRPAPLLRRYRTLSSCSMPGLPLPHTSVLGIRPQNCTAVMCVWNLDIEKKITRTLNVVLGRRNMWPSHLHYLASSPAYPNKFAIPRRQRY